MADAFDPDQMVNKRMTLVVRPRGKPIRSLPGETVVNPWDTTGDLYHRIAAESGQSIHRIKITKGSDNTSLPNVQHVSIESTGLREQSVIYVKDLGPQIAWRTVFVVEYLGPILIHPLIYFLRPQIYATQTPPSTLQTLSLILILLHFAKRELETLFIHRFSLATMPASNIVKNSFHYWFFAGLNMAYWIYSPRSPTAQAASPVRLAIAIFLFTFGELANFNTHMTLRDLRKTGGTERRIPKGFGFDLCTCPNYLFEALAWAGIWLATGSWATGLFVVVAVGQMALWAKKKENRYRKEFGDRYKAQKYCMFPGIF